MSETKFKILEICPFSAGICGVLARVMSESLEFKRLGHEVRIFSSNVVKGSDNFACLEDNIQGLDIKRFLSKSSNFSKNVYSFDFEKDIKQFNPDIVITHLLHPHSLKALNFCRQNNIPCYLVTHAPFNVQRKFPLNILTSIYNIFNIKPKINSFTKIIAITRWEVPYLLKLGVKKEKIIYIPNGLSNDFFSQKTSKTNKDVLFLGRIAPVKNIELILKAAKIIPEVNFSIVGSFEKDYMSKLKSIILKENLKNVHILPAVYDLKRKIRLIDEHKLFVLPSKREAMPQVILEAMSRGRITLASDTDGAKEIIKNNKTGFIFPSGNYKELAKLIVKSLNGNRFIENNAKKEAEKYSWKILIKHYLKIFKEK